MATDIIARGMITEYKSGTNISFTENDDGSVTISASGDVSSEDTVARETIDNHKLDKNNPHNVTAEQVGLGNVDNTADLDKPISTAVQTALDDKANTKHTHKKSDITDFPNSLPANGGDADTVNGFGVAEYVATLPEGEYYTEAARINTRDKKIESCDTSNLKVGLADYATNADYAINSDTVNNHTVDCDVPANAVFTDTTNSDVTIVGNPVTLDGLQEGVPFSEMVVSGKNLTPYPYVHTTKTVNGITFTDNGDGTITANGTATAIANFVLIWKNYHLKKGTYTISGCPEGGNVNMGFFIVCGTDSIRFAADTGNGGTFTISEDTNDFTFSIRINSGVTVDNLVFRPQLELGDTATAYEPPITGRELTVNVSGKNLVDTTKYTPKTTSALNSVIDENGIVTANVDSSVQNSTVVEPIRIPISILKKECTLSLTWYDGTINDKTENEYIYGRVLFYDSTGNFITGSSRYPSVAASKGVNRIISSSEIPIPENAAEFSVNYWITANKKLTNFRYGLQLEYGTEATEYEPYHGSTTTITPDSNPYTVPDDIRQQDGLNVVSVSEGELSVVGVRKNAAIKRIWDDMGMDLLFDGVTSTDNPAVVDLANYKFVEIHHIIIASDKTYSSNIRLSLDNYLSSTSTISTPISNSLINTIHTEEGTVSSLYAISAGGSNMNNTKIYGIK